MRAYIFLTKLSEYNRAWRAKSYTAHHPITGASPTINALSVLYQCSGPYVRTYIYYDCVCRQYYLRRVGIHLRKKFIARNRRKIVYAGANTIKLVTP